MKWFAAPLLLFLALCPAKASSAQASGQWPAKAISPHPKPEKFSFLFEISGLKLDTYRNTLTKRIDSGDTTIHLTLPKADRDAILLKMQEIQFWALPEPHPDYPKPCGQLAPSMATGSVRIEGTLGRQSRRLAWKEAQTVCADREFGQWRQLFDLTLLIYETIERQPQYQKLPSPPPRM